MFALLSLVLVFATAAGFFRPGIYFALAVQAYQFESALGDVSIVGHLLNALPIIGCLKYALRPPRLQIQKSDLLLIAILFLMLVTSLISDDIRVALSKVFRFSALGLGLYLAARIHAQQDDNQTLVPDFLATLITSAVLFSFVARSDQYGVRTAIGDGTAVGFSMVLNVSIAATGALIFFGGWRHWSRLSLVGLSVALFILFASSIENGTRGAIIGGIFGIVAAWLLSAYAKNASRTLKIGLVVAAICMMGLPALRGLAQSIDFIPGASDNERFISPLLKIVRILDPGAGDYALDTASEIRLELYANAAAMIMESPAIGNGPSAMEIQYGLYAHNLILEFWAEMGIIGVVLLLSFFVICLTAFLRAYRNRGNDGLVLSLFAIWAAMIAQLQLSFTLWMAKPLFIAAGMAVTFAIRSRVSSGTGTAPSASAIESSSHSSPRWT